MKRILLLGALTLVGCLPWQSDGELQQAAPNAPQTLWVGTTRLQAVEDEVGNGFAEVKLLSDGMMHLTLRANLVPVEEGYYEVWVGEGTSAKSIGRLDALRSDGTHSLSYVEKASVLRAPPSSQKIFVTWEKEDDNHRPNERILEGTFMVVE
jgi:hypothetical protein